MDATNEPEKAQNTTDSAQARNAGAPQIDSPSLVPEQGESAPIKDTAEPMMTSGTALVITAFDPRREREQTEQKRWRLKNWRAAKFSSLAAALALALGIGAVAGATATLGLQRALIQDNNGDTGKLQESLVRLSSEFATFKASVEASGKTASTHALTRCRWSRSLQLYSFCSESAWAYRNVNGSRSLSSSALSKERV